MLQSLSCFLAIFTAIYFFSCTSATDARAAPEPGKEASVKVQSQQEEGEKEEKIHYNSWARHVFDKKGAMSTVIIPNTTELKITASPGERIATVQLAGWQDFPETIIVYSSFDGQSVHLAITQAINEGIYRDLILLAPGKKAIIGSVICENPADDEKSITKTQAKNLTIKLVTVNSEGIATFELRSK